MEIRGTEILIVDNDLDLRFMATNRIEVRKLAEKYLSEHLADYFPLNVGEIVFTNLGWSSNWDVLWVEYTQDGEPHEHGFDITYQSFDAVIN